MRPELIVCVVVAAIGFAGWWIERRRRVRLYRYCKELEAQRQGLFDAARFVLTEVRQVSDGYTASLDTFCGLASALSAEDRAKWRCLHYEKLGADTEGMHNRWEQAAVRVENLKQEMRRELDSVECASE